MKLALSRHETLWYEDGNIVLVADTTTFRVHSSVLSRASDIFRDMFSLPQPQGEDTIDGCPVVHLPDSPHDLAIALDMLYNGMRYHLNDQPPLWTTVRAMLRMGTKYEMDALRQEAIDQLDRAFPKNLKDWDVVQLSRMEGDMSIKIMRYEDEECISIAAAAREAQLQRIHLFALYRCCQRPTKDLISHYRHSDGEANDAILHEDDMEACIDGRQRLHHADHRNAHFLFDVSSGTRCCRPAHCSIARSHVKDYLVGNFREDDLEDLQWNTNPLYPSWADEGSVLVWCKSHGLCKGCTEFYINRHTEGRQNIFETLHEYIRVPPF
ncbi:unnamed protein product [Somion occarium]|uniref:BTB domain-containing protein n=1 Tax=Somion occarium TaxID=3059160 RepID=A0ABP1CW24_9APHY